MRNLVSIGFVAALMIWAAGRACAAPPPFLLPQRTVPPAIGLPLSGMSPGKAQQAAVSGVLYSFGSGTDGANPNAGLIDVNGVLYGTTCSGGKYNLGTVFAVSTAKTERVLHSFGKGTDGVCPVAGLIYVNGILYGTTQYGGKYGSGTIFAVTPAGSERVLHTFDYYSGDGGYPVAGLTEVNGVFYGTTLVGGASKEGTVFAVTAAGSERVLENFGYPLSEGLNPGTRLTNVNGVLYGTTEGGGIYYNGTVFAITTAGVMRVVHSFGKGLDGTLPQADLIDVNGVLYGTTNLGGQYNYGTVFALTPAGAERVLHSFSKGIDGKNPAAGLIDVNGVLYGTTSHGGETGAGTVFAITTTGTERVVRNLGSCVDPMAPLIDVNGVLYSTTNRGGKYGAGTIFFESP